MTRAALGALAGVALVACSTLQVQEYYAPAAPGARPDGRVGSRCPGGPGRSLHGPPQRIWLERGPLRLGIEARPVSLRTLLAGFLFLPIFPALPPGLFPNRARRADAPIELSLRILEPRGDAEVDLDGVSVVVEHASGERITYRAVETTAEAVPFRTDGVGATEWDLADGLALSHRPGRADPERLRLVIRSIAIDATPVELPAVRLRLARGLVYCEQTPRYGRP